MDSDKAATLFFDYSELRVAARASDTNTDTATRFFVRFAELHDTARMSKRDTDTVTCDA